MKSPNDPRPSRRRAASNASVSTPLKYFAISSCPMRGFVERPPCTSGSCWSVSRWRSTFATSCLADRPFKPPNMAGGNT
eukprot:6490246-Amphidinium_carterae.2